MTIERDDLELLINRVEAMRAAQRAYFKHRTDTDKKKSMAMEGHVDKILQTLRRKGYEPDRFNSKTDQGNIF